MHLEWNKVTWYSKLLALAVLVVLPFFGFYLGSKYGETVAILDISETQSQVPSAFAHGSKPQLSYWVPSGAKVPCNSEQGCYLYTDEKYGFSFKYPADLQVLDIKYPTINNGIACLVSADLFKREEVSAHANDNELGPVAHTCVITKETYAARKQTYAAFGYDPEARQLSSGFMLIIEAGKYPEISQTLGQL